MRTRVFAVVLLLVAASAFADEQPSGLADRDGRQRTVRGQQYVLSPQHVLSDAERADLASKGVTVLRPLADGRYLVRRAPSSTIDANDNRVRSLELVTAAKKIQPSAYRVAAFGRAFVMLNVIFSDDVSFEDARAAIIAAGGALDDVLATDFVPPQRIRARVSPATLSELAADERVIVIYSGAPFIGRSYNASEQFVENVTPLQAAPYNLTGEGLVLSYFELGPGEATHKEFEGRLINEYACKGTTDTTCNDTGNKAHATHTAGTMIAAGIDPEAKGIAPKATLHGYRALCDGQTECGTNAGADWLATKQNTLKTIGSVADNNSWGVVLGWDRGDSGGWIWYGYDELIGGYEFTDAALDKAARVNGSLMVHSAGNEALVGGPQAAPFAHQHVDQNFKVVDGETFCFSTDGSGNDCPAPPTCTAGVSAVTGEPHCEKERHPTHTPFGSIGLLASPKNILTVGATTAAKNISNFSSRGPTKDGRVKPEITAVGSNVKSTLLNNSYGLESGTSMAAPMVAGTAAILSQLWKRTFNSAASPVALKTVLIAGAQDLGNPGPDYTFGYGFLNGKASADLIVADGGTGKRIQIKSVAQGAQYEVPMTLTSTQDLRVVVGWSDPEVLILGDQIADATLVNDLDVKVIGPNNATVLPYVLDKTQPNSNATQGVNTIDNTEEVEIPNAAPGVYRIIVTGKRVTTSSQEFVLIGNGDVGTAAPPCVDANEPNDTPTSAFGYLPSGETATGRICSQTDIDYFKVKTNSNDPVVVTVTAGDTPLRVTVSSSFSSATMDVPANTTNNVQTSLGLGISPLPTVDVLIKVEPIGAIGANASYTITSTYTYTAPPRRRAARG